MTYTLDLDAIMARADKATEGPWSAHTTGVRGGDHWYICDRDEAIAHISAQDGINEDQREPDAEFIAHAREDVPALVARVRELEQHTDHWQTLAEKLGDRAAEVREFAYDLGHDPGSTDIAASIHRVLDGGCAMPRTLDPDKLPADEIESILDSLPVHAVVTTNDEAGFIAWAKCDRAVGKPWESSLNGFAYESQFLAQHCGVLTVLR